jgi:hypothetical protein
MKEKKKKKKERKRRRRSRRRRRRRKDERSEGTELNSTFNSAGFNMLASSTIKLADEIPTSRPPAPAGSTKAATVGKGNDDGDGTEGEVKV